MKKMNKVLAFALVALLSFSTVGAWAQSLSPNTKWHWEKGTIVIDSPARPAGQQHALGLKVDPIKIRTRPVRTCANKVCRRFSVSASWI